MIPKEILSLLQSYFKKDEEFLPEKIKFVGGGSINHSLQFTFDKQVYFIKYNHAAKFPAMFEKEARGLRILLEANEIDCPESLYHNAGKTYSFLLMKYIHSAPQQKDFWTNFGRKLAALHRHTHDKFGLDHSNYIGSLPQYNNYCGSWAEFFITQRLEVQLAMGRDSGAIDKNTTSKFNSLFSKMENLFPLEPPALVHGDLWSGNYMVGESGQACIIDPAVYYGHREMDLGMSKLFGGFDREFYNSYNRSFPLEAGWQERLDICKLYPLLVHVNLFGGGYLNSVIQILNRYHKFE